MSFKKCSTKKPGSKLPAINARTEVIQAPRARRTATDTLEHRIQIQARLCAVEQHLTDADHIRRDQDLIDHLRMLPGTRRALVDNRFPHRLKERIQSGDDLGFPADHDREPCLAPPMSPPETGASTA